MATGTVTWFNPKKYVGFIVSDDGRKAVICLMPQVSRSRLASLSEGQKVSFDYARGEDGKLLLADNIKPLD